MRWFGRTTSPSRPDCSASMTQISLGSVARRRPVANVVLDRRQLGGITDAVDEEDAIEMVELVLQNRREKPLGLQ